jgi:hypothetical protein
MPSSGRMRFTGQVDLSSIGRRAGSLSLAMEGKLHAEGLQAVDREDDFFTAMARGLVTWHGEGAEAAEVCI